LVASSSTSRMSTFVSVDAGRVRVMRCAISAPS
jgi:hypothetical protein